MKSSQFRFNMPPRRTQKRARRTGSSTPTPEANTGSSASDSDSSMRSGDQHRQAKRPRASSQLSNNSNNTNTSSQMQFSNIHGVPLVLPQIVAQPTFMRPEAVHAQLSSPPNLLIQSPPEALVVAAPQPANLRIAGHQIETVGITLPGNLTIEEYQRRREDLRLEIELRRTQAPALPRSTVADLPPKPPSEPWVPFPDDVDEELTEKIMAENNRISADMQRVDRQRNNLAAKKSRHKRLEALENTRKILNDCFVELGWWKLKAISMGVSKHEYANVPQVVKESFLKEVQKDVKEIDDFNDKLRKEEESRRRAERNRARSQARREAMQSTSPEA
ncbi:hypothetical protein BGZ63DRAFT_452537 [Mariannaea sp. PMI_226]|nr:hypothetical protein BGZ63DRAFT_452537 [Mariannaea sp. PMI_226]